jgi:hypothetical protein
LFGRFQVKAPRIRRCACNAKSVVALGGPLSQLARFFPDRSTPELQRLQAELGARHSFREAARIIEIFLPCAKQANTSVRNRLGKIAKEISDSEYVELAGSVVSRRWWKFPGGELRACEIGSVQAARSRGIGLRG